MKRIVHMSSVHRGDDTRIYVKECLTLRDAGYAVTLIARPPDSNAKIDIPFLQVRTGAGNRLVRMTRTVLETAWLAFRARGNIYHFHDPELIPLGLVLKLVGKKVVYDVHENVPKQIKSKFWLPNPARGPVAALADLLERMSARVYDGVVVATPGIAERFPADRTRVIQNFALLSEFLSIRNDDYVERKALCLYVGGITEARGLQSMVEAIARTDARLLLVGSFNPPSLKNDARMLRGWERVDYLGWLSRGGVHDSLAKSRIGLILLKPEPNYLDSYPVKIFEYMAAGVPIIASDFPFWRQFVLDTGAGLTVNPLNPNEIADAITWLLDHPEEAKAMGERGRNAAVAMYSWEHEAEKLLDFYETVV